MEIIHIRKLLFINIYLKAKVLIYIKWERKKIQVCIIINQHREEKSESSSEASKSNSPSSRKSPGEYKGQTSNGHEASEEGSESDKSNTEEDFEMLWDWCYFKKIIILSTWFIFEFLAIF